jgi:hypothetical protein
METKPTKRDNLETAMREIKKAMMWQRRFGQDTLAGYRNACTMAEDIAERALATLDGGK